MESFAVCPKRLRADVERLDFSRNRLDRAESMARAEEAVLSSWAECGWRVERQEFEVDTALLAVAQNLSFGERSRLRGCNGANLVAFKPPTRGNRVFVVGAHLDTLSHTHGADDNTSGIAGLLELARVLQGRSFRDGVALVAFDMEEWNLLGSRAFVERFPLAVSGVVNFECIGYFSDQAGSQAVPPGLSYLYPRLSKALERGQFRGDFSLLVHRAPGQRLARALAAALQAGGQRAFTLRDPADLPVVGGLLARRLPFVRHFGRSDHAPFWERGIEAVMITDTAEFRNPFYHSEEDLSYRLDYPRMAEVVRATAGVVYQQAGSVYS